MNGFNVCQCFFLGMIANSLLPIVATSAENFPTLDGRWKVTSAEYQLTGPVTYTFNGDRLSIEARQRDKYAKGANAETVHREEWKYAVNASASPRTLVLKSIPPSGGKQVTRTETIEFKEGRLFISGHNRSPGWNSELQRMPDER